LAETARSLRPLAPGGLRTGQIRGRLAHLQIRRPSPRVRSSWRPSHHTSVRSRDGSALLSTRHRGSNCSDVRQFRLGPIGRSASRVRSWCPPDRASRGVAEEGSGGRRVLGVEQCVDGGDHLVRLVPCLLSSFAVGVVQVRASQGRRGRDTGSYADRGERREVRTWAARTVKRLRRHDTGPA
jgi:hypothetical protein